MIEHFFQCPHCWEEISVLLDPSIYEQAYVEDCEICCNPIDFQVQFNQRELQNFQVSSHEQ